MFKHVKYISVEYIITLLFGIFGYFVLFYFCILTSLEDYLDVAGCKSVVIVSMFIGVPTGASFGVLIAKKIFSKMDKCLRCFIAALFCSLLLVYLTVRFLFPVLMNLLNVGLSLDIVFFIIVPIYALSGYSIGMKLGTVTVPHKHI